MTNHTSENEETTLQYDILVRSGPDYNDPGHKFLHFQVWG